MARAACCSPSLPPSPATPPGGHLPWPALQPQRLQQLGGHDNDDDEGDGDDDDDVEDDDDACMPCDLFQRTHFRWLSGVPPVRGRHFRARRGLCCPQTESPLRRERVPQGLPDGAIWKSSHHWPGEENHCSKFCAHSAILSAWRQEQHDPGLKLVCGHRPLMLLGRVGVPHDSPTTRPRREGYNSGTAFVHDLQRLQRGHSGKAHWRPTRLDTELRSARARGTPTSGGQAEKQCFLRQGPARETEGSALDGAKRQRRHGRRQRPPTAQRR